MATFVQGVTDNFEQELYTPDFAFLSTAMGQRQARYDKGFNAFKNLASSALNSALTNAENQRTRQDIFKKIQDNLKSTAGLDLSDQSNVAQAMSILDPIVNDKEILYDMSITRQNQEAASRLEAVKNSFDSDVRNMYNEYSELDIQQQAQKLKTAKRGDGSIMQVQPGEFIPYENPAEMLNKAAKEIGLDVEITQAMGDGYLRTYKNGKIAVDPFTNWAITTMGKKYDRYFNQVGKVQTESSINNLVSQRNISRTEATQLLATDMTKSLINEATVRGQQSDQKIRDYDLRLSVFHQVAGKNGGKIVNKAAYDKLVAERNNYVNELAKSKTDLTNLNSKGVEYVISNMGNIIADKYKHNAASEWAINQAGATAKVEMKADEVQLTKWRLSQAESQFQRTMDLNERKFKYQMANDDANRQLKILELGASGKIPTTSYVGQVGGTDLPAISSLQASKERVTEGLMDNTFGAGGIFSMVYNPSTYNKMTNTINKLRSVSKNEKATFSEDDRKNLNSMFKTFAIENAKFNPNDPASAQSLLKKIAIGAISKASEHIIDDNIKAGNIPDSKPFREIQANIRTLLETDKALDESYNTIADIVSPGNNGYINPTFKGVTIIGRTSAGKPIYDFTNTSEDAKKFISTTVSKQFQNGAVTSTQYTFNKLSDAEFLNIIKSKADNQQVSEKLAGMSKEQAKAGYSDYATVTFNPVDKTVSFTLKPATGDSKKTSIAESVTYTMTYDEAATIPSERLRSGIMANTMSNKALGIAVDLYKNPNGSISSPAYMEKFGYRYDIQRTKDVNGNPGVYVTIGKKNHLTNTWNDSPGRFIAMDLDNKAKLLELDNGISMDFSQYLAMIQTANATYLKSSSASTINPQNN
jgi:hypothetical protein